MTKTIVIVPTYNERENISDLITEIFKAAPEVKVMIVDDNSPDGTADIVSAMQKIYPNLILFSRLKKSGLGAAYKDALEKAMREFPELEIIVMMDADFTHDPKDLPYLLENSADFDIVIGSAHLTKEGLADYSFFRNLLSKWANFYCRRILGYKLTDWTNNFAAIKTSLLKKVDLAGLDVKEFAFVFGLKFWLLRQGASWKEIPIINKIRHKGESKMKFSTIIEGVVAPWRLRFPNKRKKIYLEGLLRKLRYKKVSQRIKKEGFLLDVGCGPDFIFLKMNMDKIKFGYGLDKNADNLDFKNIKIIKLNLDDNYGIPINSDSIDQIFMLATFEHLARPEKILGEFYRLLKRDGEIFLTTPAKLAKPILEFLAYKVGIVDKEGVKDHKYYFSKNELREMFKKSGFEMVKHRYFELGLNQFLIFRK